MSQGADQALGLDGGGVILDLSHEALRVSERAIRNSHTSC